MDAPLKRGDLVRFLYPLTMDHTEAVPVATVMHQDHVTGEFCDGVFYVVKYEKDGKTQFCSANIKGIKLTTPEEIMQLSLEA